METFKNGGQDYYWKGPHVVCYQEGTDILRFLKDNVRFVFKLILLYLKIYLC